MVQVEDYTGMIAQFAPNALSDQPDSKIGIL
jgi:hypothetical protein